VRDEDEDLVLAGRERAGESRLDEIGGLAASGRGSVDERDIAPGRPEPQCRLRCGRRQPETGAERDRRGGAQARRLELADPPGVGEVVARMRADGHGHGGQRESEDREQKGAPRPAGLPR
jgi:hypothetical protein